MATKTVNEEWILRRLWNMQVFWSFSQMNLIKQEIFIIIWCKPWCMRKFSWILGFGKFHYWLLLVCGWANASDAIELLCISFLLPSAECDLKLTTSDKGWLSATAFIGTRIKTKLFFDSFENKIFLFKMPYKWSIIFKECYLVVIFGEASAMSMEERTLLL